MYINLSIIGQDGAQQERDDTKTGFGTDPPIKIQSSSKFVHVSSI
jgi:hypothetical protein